MLYQCCSRFVLSAVVLCLGSGATHLNAGIFGRMAGVVPRELKHAAQGGWESSSRFCSRLFSNNNDVTDTSYFTMTPRGQEDEVDGVRSSTAPVQFQRQFSSNKLGRRNLLGRSISDPGGMTPAQMDEAFLRNQPYLSTDALINNSCWNLGGMKKKVAADRKAGTAILDFAKDNLPGLFPKNSDLKISWASESTISDDDAFHGGLNYATEEGVVFEEATDFKPVEGVIVSLSEKAQKELDESQEKLLEKSNSYSPRQRRKMKFVLDQLGEGFSTTKERGI